MGARFSPVFAASRSGSSVRYTLRLVLSDLCRLDTVAVRDMPMMPMLMGWWQVTNRTRRRPVVRLYDDGSAWRSRP